MTCKTHEKIKDAIEEVRASLISALENKEEDIVADLYEVYGKLRKISHSNISSGSTFMSYEGSPFGSGSTHVTIDPSNHPDFSCANNAKIGYGDVSVDDTVTFL
jgi:hypothetical protein